MNALHLFGDEVAFRLTLTLCHFLWQGSLLGLAAMLLAWLLRSASATSRYAVNVAVLSLMVACLPVTWVLLPAQNHLSKIDGHSPRPKDQTRLPLTPSQGPTPSNETKADEKFDPLPGQPNAWDKAARTTKGEDVKAPSISSVPDLPGLLVIVSPYSALAYSCGVLAMLLRLACAIGRSHRLRRHSILILDKELLRLIHQRARMLGISATPAVAWCEHVLVPVVVGVIQPMILLPATMGTGVAPHVLQALLIHELAHIRRLDPLVNMLQRLCEALLFFHPAVWYVSGALSMEREHGCDDVVLASGVSRLDYADALVRMAERCSASRNLGSVATLSAGERPSQFKRRVLRVLDPKIPHTFQLTPAALLSMVLLLAAAMLAQIVPMRAGHAQNRAGQSRDTEQVRAIQSGDVEEQDLAQTDSWKESARAAAEQGIAFLKTQQLPNGSWRWAESFELGSTALVTLALLESGVDTEDPHVARALQRVAAGESDFNYDIALQTVVLCRADTDEFKQRIEKNIEALSNTQLRHGRSGMWSYSTKAGFGDLSNTSFALWALDTAAESGFVVGDEVWQRSYESLESTQSADGGWGYIEGSEITGSMTASGMVGIAICADRLSQAGREESSASEASLKKALEWLSANFSITHNPSQPSWHLYYLHTLQRAAHRTGTTTFGPHDWYQSGCRLLVEQQHADGHWSGRLIEANPVLATSLALLFLQAGDGRAEHANGDRQSRRQTRGERTVADGAIQANDAANGRVLAVNPGPSTDDHSP